MHAYNENTFSLLPVNSLAWLQGMALSRGWRFVLHKFLQCFMLKVELNQTYCNNLYFEKPAYAALVDKKYGENVNLSGNHWQASQHSKKYRVFKTHIDNTGTQEGLEIFSGGHLIQACLFIVEYLYLLLKYLNFQPLFVSASAEPVGLCLCLRNGQF